MKQLTVNKNRVPGITLKEGRTGAFTDNMKLPIHRWYRFSAGFSSQWVEKVIKNKLPNGGTVLDPFAGSGTTLLAAISSSVDSIGFEQHSFIYRIAKAKLFWNDVDLLELRKASVKLLDKAKELEKKREMSTSPLVLKCYSEEALVKLIALRNAYFKARITDEALNSLLWLAITAVLRPSSFAGTAPWQYVLPNKKKAKVKDPYLAFELMIEMMTKDINQMRQGVVGKRRKAVILHTNAKKPIAPKNLKADLVITSPPYPNNYDYADATRLELSFWGEIEKWGDLHELIRKDLVTSCSQHSAKERMNLDKVLQNLSGTSIYEEIKDVCNRLSVIRLEKGGRKTYHTMIAAYFSDLFEVLKSLRKITKNSTEMCFVVGDSAPYGVYVPVDDWLGKLAIDAGFSSYKFEKIRDRNTKWKNRKHRVLLKEGNLWIK